MISPLSFAIVVSLLGQITTVAGSIRGVVVNASQDDVPVSNAEVVLRVIVDGQMVIAAEGLADDGGRFSFDDIPADSQYVYVPGANHLGVHYPSSRIRLSPEHQQATVELAIHDTIAEPCPLVVRRHDIVIHSESAAVRVSERLIIENPGALTYVGVPKREGGRAATLRLSIPADFQRVTFDKEFYGRQFTLIDNQLVSDIPFTPGSRELAFTYVVPDQARERRWHRPLDLPCEHIRVEVHSEASAPVACSLPRSSTRSEGVAMFESSNETLPAGYVLHVDLDGPSVTLASHGRWFALGVLVVLIAGTLILWLPARRKRDDEKREPKDANRFQQAA